MSTPSRLLKFTDKDGEPVYVANDIVAIYTSGDKSESRAFGYAGPVAVAEGPSHRVVVSQATGHWTVTESFEEILALISEANSCE